MSFWAALRGWSRPAPHPETGDILSPTERLSWAVMKQYRKWRWFIAFRVLFWVWYCNPQWFGDDRSLTLLVLVWSDLAIMMEQIMGLSFFPQSIRDAKVMREEMATLKQDLKLDQDSIALLRKVAAKLGVDEGEAA